MQVILNTELYFGRKILLFSIVFIPKSYTCFRFFDFGFTNLGLQWRTYLLWLIVNYHNSVFFWKTLSKFAHSLWKYFKHRYVLTWFEEFGNVRCLCQLVSTNFFHIIITDCVYIKELLFLYLCFTRKYDIIKQKMKVHKKTRKYLKLTDTE